MFPPDQPLSSKELPVQCVFTKDYALTFTHTYVMKKYHKNYKRRAERLQVSPSTCLPGHYRCFWHTTCLSCVGKLILLQLHTFSNTVITYILLHSLLRISKTTSTRQSLQGALNSENRGQLFQYQCDKDKNTSCRA